MTKTEHVKMRPLLINESQKAKVREVVAFALANLYYPYVVSIPIGYRCVFSIIVDSEGKLWRHLSISVPKKEKKYPYPNLVAAFAIADVFGFTGYNADALYNVDALPSDWLIHVCKEDHCIVLAQVFER